MGLAGGVGDRRRARRQRRRHQGVLGAHHRGLVHEDRAGAESAVGRGQLDPAVALDPGAEVDEGVEVGVEPAAADEVAPRRRHPRLAEARQERPGDEEGGADAVREVAVDLDLGHVAGAEAEAVVRHPDRLDPEALEQRDLGLGVADPRNPVQEQLLLGQKAGGEDRQGGVLVARSGDLAAERRPSLDDEFLHRVPARVTAAMRRGWKILIAVIAALVVLLVLNDVATTRETKSAEVTEPGGRILSLTGGDLQVVDRGPRDGSPIVLIHCYSCAINWWDGVMPLLDKAHRVIAVDLLGHGGSEKPDSGYSIPNQADLVAQALGRLGVKNASRRRPLAGRRRRDRARRTIAGAGLETGDHRQPGVARRREQPGDAREAAVRAGDRAGAVAGQARLLDPKGARGRVRARLRRPRSRSSRTSGR